MPPDRSSRNKMRQRSPLELLDACLARVQMHSAQVTELIRELEELQEQGTLDPTLPPDYWPPEDFLRDAEAREGDAKRLQDLGRGRRIQGRGGGDLGGNGDVQVAHCIENARELLQACRDARDLLPEVAADMDDTALPVVKRWTGQLDLTLQRIAAALKTGQPLDFYPSSMPKLGEGIDEKLMEHYWEIETPRGELRATQHLSTAAADRAQQPSAVPAEPKAGSPSRQNNGNPPHAQADTSRNGTPSHQLIHAIDGIVRASANAGWLDSEAKRRREAQEWHTRSLNAAAETVKAQLGAHVSAVDVFDALESLKPREEFAPTPLNGDPREVIQSIADELMDNAEIGEGAVRAGDAGALDQATTTNADGQPRSIELSILLEEARSLSSRIEMCIADTRLTMDNDAEQLRALGKRLNTIRQELAAALAKPKHDPPQAAQPTQAKHAHANADSVDPNGDDAPSNDEADPIVPSSGAPIARTTPEVPPQSHPVPKPDGWTRAELIAQANHDDGDGSKTLSGTTFDRIRNAAGIPSAEKGGVGAQRRFSVAQLRKLIDAAEVGGTLEERSWKPRNGQRIAEAWRELLPS